MGLKLGQKLNFQPFLGFCPVFGRDKAFWSRQSFLVATLVTTAFLGRDTGRDSLPGRDTGRDILPGRDILS